MNVPFQTAGETASSNYSERKDKLYNTGLKNYFVERPDVVHETEKYELFRFLTGNREVNAQMVKRLAMEIKEHGQLVPILVNEKFEAIDGQHRLMACKSIGIPVRFIVQSGMRMSEIISINTNSRKWSEIDYINRFAEEGSVKYIELRDWIKECSDFGIQFAVAIARNSLMQRVYGKNLNGELVPIYSKNKGGEYIGTYGSDIRNGKWNGFDLKAARIRLNDIRAIKKSMPEGAWKDRMGEALIQIMRIPEFSVNVLIQQLRGSGGTQLRNPVNTEDAVKVIEDVYNYRRPYSSRLAMVINPSRRAKK